LLARRSDGRRALLTRERSVLRTGIIVQHRSSPRRSWLTAIGAGVGLLAAALVLGEAFEWRFLRAPLQQALADKLQRPVQLDAPFGVRFIGGLRLHTAQLVIGPAADAAPQPGLVRARALRVTLPYATLWQLARGRNETPPVIDTLVVDDLQAHLLRDAQGRANWRFERSADPARPQASSGLPRIGLLQIQRGEIQLEDVPQQLSLHASVRTQEGGAGTSSGLTVQARGSHRGLPLTADLQSSGLLPLMRSNGGDATVPVRLDLRIGRAQLKLDGNARDALQLGGLDAAVELSAPSLAAVGDALGLTLPTTATFDMRGRVRKDGTVWSAAIASWRVGSSRLRGDFRYEPERTPPLLTGTLGGERLALADLGPVIGTRADARPAAATAAGRVLPQREFDIPSLQRMDADVALRLDRLDLGTALLEPLAPLQGRVRLQRGVLSVQELLAHAGGGTVRGEITVDARTQQTPSWRADLRWGGIELERFVKARNNNAASATAQRAPGYVSGALGGSANVTGRGRSIGAVMATLDGKAGLWVRDGSVSHLGIELAGIDLAESLGVLITGDQRLPLRCAVTQWTLRDGIARPETALIDTRDTTLLINGELSLAKETLALVVTAQPHDMSLFSLRAPLRINGTFADPQVKLDKSRIALRLAGAAALAVLAPPAALLALVDLGEDDRQQCAEAVKRSQALNKPVRPARPPNR
jgi:AsmA family protein